MEIESEDPNEEKLDELSRILEKLQPVQWKEEFQKEIFYKEHIIRRQQYEKRKRNYKKKILAKAAIILLIISTSAQAVCYAVTRKSVFYYLNQMKEWIQTIEFQIKSDDSNEQEIGDYEEGEMVESDAVIVRTWKEALEKSERSYIWPRKSLPGWNLEEIQIQMMEGKGDMLTAFYENGNQNFSVMMSYEEGEGGGIIQYDEPKKKVKEIHQNTGDYYIYKGTDNVIVEGFYKNIQISVEGKVRVKEIEKWIKSLR